MFASSPAGLPVGYLPSLPGIDLPRRFRPSQRRRRDPFSPGAPVGPYRLPSGVSEALGRLLAPFRNREATFALAVFLARHWSSRDRLGREFPICRRSLADHPKLGLSEGRIKGAIALLERVGFIERPLTVKGSGYRATEEGLRRKPILFRFGAWFAGAFQEANRKAGKARQATKVTGVIGTARPPGRPVTNLTKRNPIGTVIMGKIERAIEDAVVTEPNSPLEQALASWRSAILRE